MTLFESPFLLGFEQFERTLNREQRGGLYDAL